MSSIPDLFYIDRSDRGRLKLTGRDRQTFLQGMVTNDIVALQPGHGCYAFMLDATGHVLADMRILYAPDHLLLDVEPGMAPFVAETLDRYLIMERVKITDITSESGQLTVGGVGALQALHRAFGLQVSAEHQEGDNLVVDTHGDIILIAAARIAPVPAFDLYFALPESREAVLRALVEGEGAEAISAELLDALRVEAGIPRFGIDMDSRTLAPETGQQRRAIHYRKGCYIGQEIVARIDARGHTNRELAGFWLEGNALPVPGTPVTVEGKEVGRITSSAIGPLTGRPIALGYIRREYGTHGTRVTVGEGTATVASLPFAGTGSDN